ncbi:MAG: diaminopimelate decarboxylase [Lentisphaerae bacterium]|jgi:diaminopimelate decarboxylase|nr:diaminopimelate decarboxylase [Lentisphaerota bacterium]MBT4817402.1 diaminopimelate decarboxylase [Lentisphaerota bacterium]MBT5608447.1 diaminopimelate decarboxylase [Lentisphaerota bacterium]MBT7055153.1 diaminopimelate decarboxylase [Lentisphaerota bacterium]MBT7841299.1 diaminopimelate decarboxylase [Lentisphaerota bacterium]
MRKEYERPVITKLQSGLMNKFGGSPAYSRKVKESIAGVSIDDLVSRHGSPLFVFSERAIRRRCHHVHSAYSTRYPNVTFAWSYKTNYLDAVCAIMHQEGALAEVVSSMEYDKARRLGVPGDQIIFNGPYKPMDALERAVSEGAQINIDHLDELQDLEVLATRLERKISVGLRLNLDAGIHPQWSRFGFNLESGQAADAAKRLVNGGKLTINALHCHIGTFILEPSAYARQVEKMVDFAYELQDSFGMSIERIDVGGGLPSCSRLKGTMFAPELSVPSVDQFAEELCDALSRRLRPGDCPELILESGRAMIDEAGWLITTVEASKRLPEGIRAYILDAGVNTLFTSFWYKFNVEIDREVNGVNETSVLYGPLCMNIDVLDDGIPLPPLSRGTRLIFSPVGAYNVTQWMQFIHYRPCVVLIGQNGEVDVIRDGEDLTDLTRRERLPERLALNAFSSSSHDTQGSEPVSSADE